MTDFPGPALFGEQAVKPQMGASKSQEAGMSRESLFDQCSLNNDKPTVPASGARLTSSSVRQEARVLDVVSKGDRPRGGSACWHGVSEKETRLNGPMTL